MSLKDKTPTVRELVVLCWKELLFLSVVGSVWGFSWSARYPHVRTPAPNPEPISFVRFVATFDDTAYSRYHEPMRRNLEAAADEWGRHLSGSACIELKVKIRPLPTHTLMQSDSRLLLDDAGSLQTAAADAIEAYAKESGFRRGPDATATIIVNSTALERLWFEPPPGLHERIPCEGLITKTDAYTAFEHEVGHVLGFSANDSGSPTIYSQLIGTYLGERVFMGPAATAQNAGNPVPLDRKSPDHIHHILNQTPSGYLQFGAVMESSIAGGTRLHVSTVELSMLKDMGLPVMGWSQTGQTTAASRSQP